MKNFGKYLKKALAVTLVLLVLCGVVYPLLLTAAGQVIFPKQANGSIVKVNDKAAGSEVVGQEFEGNQYFQKKKKKVENMQEFHQEALTMPQAAKTLRNV